jgi:hypothetical protein
MRVTVQSGACRAFVAGAARFLSEAAIRCG